MPDCGFVSAGHTSGSDGEWVIGFCAMADVRPAAQGCSTQCAPEKCAPLHRDPASSPTPAPGEYSTAACELPAASPLACVSARTANRSCSSQRFYLIGSSHTVGSQVPSTKYASLSPGQGRIVAPIAVSGSCSSQRN